MYVKLLLMFYGFEWVHINNNLHINLDKFI